MVFWDVQVKDCLILKALRSIKTPVNMYQVTWRNIPVELKLQQHRCESLISRQSSVTRSPLPRSVNWIFSKKLSRLNSVQVYSMCPHCVSLELSILTTLQEDRFYSDDVHFRHSNCAHCSVWTKRIKLSVLSSVPPIYSVRHEVSLKFETETGKSSLRVSEQMDSRLGSYALENLLSLQKPAVLRSKDRVICFTVYVLHSMLGATLLYHVAAVY